MPRRPLHSVAIADAALSLLAACSDSTATSPSAPAVPDAPNELLGISLGLPVFGGSSDGARLVSCPSSGSTLSLRGLIGVDGGVLSAGAVKLEVPSGAVLLPTLFQVATPPSKAMEVSLTAVGVEHYVFQRPVTVTIDYSRCGLDAVPEGAVLEAVHIAPISKRILENMGGTVDPAARTITFTTGHFSSYAVAYRNAPAPEEP